MKTHKPMPPLELLRDLFEMNGRDLVYRSEHGHGGYMPAGKIAGSIRKTSDKKRYRYIYAEKSYFLAHRIVYFMFSGVDPGRFVVDHIDGDSLNNNPLNLRPATQRQNLTNQNLAERDTYSRIRGVHKADSKSMPYCVHMRVNGRQKHMGSFKTIDEAAEFAEFARSMVYGEYAGAA